MRFHGGLYVVLERPIFLVGNVLHAQQLLDFFPAFVRDGRVLVFFVYDKVASVNLRFARRRLDLLTFLEVRDNPVHPRVLVGGFFAGAADDERGAGLVNQDGVNFVDDADVGYVGRVGFPALLVVKIMDDHTHTQSQKAVELAHPLGVAFCQIVVDRDNVDAFAGQRVQINRKSGNQRFTFTGLHF